MNLNAYEIATQQADAWRERYEDAKMQLTKAHNMIDALEKKNDALKEQLDNCEKQNVLLRDSIKKYLSDNDPEGFGCACSPNHLCGPCRAERSQRPLYEALAATQDLAGLVVCDAVPVGDVIRYGKDSCGRMFHGLNCYDPDVSVPEGTKLYVANEKTNPNCKEEN